jgi:predicted MFS family arabinose efflux permease
MSMTAPAAAPNVAPRERRRMGGLLWQRNFRLFWAGETVSELGDTTARVAMPLLAVFVLHASTFAVTFLTATAYLPWLLIGLPAGAWVDRLSCRPLMIACDLAAALLYASLPVAAWLGVLTIGHIIAVAAAAGCAGVLFSTAYQVYLTSIVATGDLVEGNAKLQGSASAAAIGGPGIAGLLAGTVGSAAALLVNAVSFLVSAACLFRVRTEARAAPAVAAAPAPARTCVPPGAPGTAEVPAPPMRTGIRQEIADGVRYVAGDPYLRPLTISAALVNLGLTGYGALLIVFLVRVVGLGPGLTGLLLAISGVGGLLGALVASRLSSSFGSARALLLSLPGAMPFGLLIPLTGPGLRLAFFVAGVLIAVSGIVAGSIILGSFRQAYCPPQLLGRVTATMRFLLVGTNPIGALLAGGLGTWLGVRSALWIMLGIAVLSGALLLTRTFRGIRELPARQ